jgi:hypothetical protein
MFSEVRTKHSFPQPPSSLPFEFFRFLLKIGKKDGFIPVQEQILALMN